MPTKGDYIARQQAEALDRNATEEATTQPSSTVNQILSRPLTPKELAYQRKQDELNGGASAVTESTETPEFKPMQFYDEFISSQNGYKPETPAERQAREKSERTNKIIAGVGDMISAIANMYYTTKGAPSSYDPKEGMTPKMQARYDQLQKEREAREKDYLSGLQRARQLDQQYNLSWQQLKEKRERWKAQDEERRQRLAEEKAYKDELLEIKRKEAEEKATANRNREAIQRERNNKTGGRGKASSSTGKDKVVEKFDKNGNLLSKTVTSLRNASSRVAQAAGKGKWAAYKQ